MGPRFVRLGNHRTTTPFSLGNTRPSERKSCFSGNHWTTTLFSLGNTRPSERQVGFRWTSWLVPPPPPSLRPALEHNTSLRAHFEALTIYPSPPCCAPFLYARLLPFLPGLPTSSQRYARFSHRSARRCRRPRLVRGRRSRHQHPADARRRRQ